MAIDADKIKSEFSYDFDLITFTPRYDLPNNLTLEYQEFKDLKSQEYSTLTPEELARLESLSTQLEPYSITAVHYNKLFTLTQNMQQFISTDFPNYVNKFLKAVATEVNTSIKNIDDKLTEIEDEWKILKLSLSINKSFAWDNWLILPNVDYYSIQVNTNKVVETLMFKDLTFGTYTTVLSNNNIVETIVITDPFDSTTLYNRTKTTVFNADGTIKESVKDN